MKSLFDRDEIQKIRCQTDDYLRQTLLPFWIERAIDQQYGGFLTYYDRNGQATGETDKTFLMQIRSLYTFAAAHRAGYSADGKCLQLARSGADFILNHYQDQKNEGWIWIADRQGNPLNRSKIGYGQCFAIYAMSEYYLASGDARGRQAALDTYAAIQKNMRDTRFGGYYEIMQEDWQPERPGRFGGDRKGFDVHMHMMEALTRLYEMTHHLSHRRRLLEVISLILERMLHPEYRVGYMQFSLDFTPLAAILFETEWGRDAAPADGVARPLDTTSYGHNVEFSWLLLHALEILDKPAMPYLDVIRKIADHCCENGIDWQYGGVCVDGPFNGPPTDTEKQFWQQAEVLVGMLDACLLFGDERYWRAFVQVYHFVFDKFICWAGGGEWFERLDRQGNLIDDALGHAWKINYHTVRSMIQVVHRLDMLLNR